MMKRFTLSKRSIGSLPIIIFILFEYNIQGFAQLATHSAISGSGTGAISGNLTDGTLTGTFAITPGASSGYTNNGTPSATASNGSGAGFEGITLQYNGDNQCFDTTRDDVCGLNQGDFGNDAIVSTYTVVPGTGILPQIRVAQKLDGTNGNDEGSDWTFTWSGGGTATWYDNATPEAQLYRFVTDGGYSPVNSEDINNTTHFESGFAYSHREIQGASTTGTLNSGESLRIYATNNNRSKWYIEFPVGVSSVTVTKTALTGSTGSHTGEGQRIPALGYGGQASANIIPACTSISEFGCGENPTRIFQDGATFNEWVSFGVDLVLGGSLSGTVFNDPDALTDNTVDGTGIGSPDGTQLHANLLDASGNVVATVPVNADGTYTFNKLLAGSYSVQISTVAGTVGSAAPATSLPSGWENTGENIGAGAGSDGNVNGISGTATVTLGAETSNVNFGIQERPKDYGDLPTTGTPNYPDLVAYNYKDTNSDGKPNDNIAVWLGDVVSYETSTIGNADATGDVTGDDGLAIKTQAPPTGTGRTGVWTVTVNSVVSKTVYYQLRVDWNLDGTFEDIYSGSLVTNSPASTDITVNVPDSYTSGSLVNVRLVAADSQTEAAKTSEPISNGEVEDYQFSSQQVLPVELISFSGNHTGSYSRLQWVTASEVNNDGFEIERSIDGKSFTKIAWVDGQGTSTDKNSYYYNDYKSPNTNIVYYRLNQIDFDGRNSFSHMVSVRKDIEGIYIYPNPIVTDIMQIAHSREGDTYEFIDINGKVIQTGWATSKVDVSELSKGSYILRLYDENGQLKYSESVAKTQ